MKQNACIHFLILAWPLIVFWIDAANCLFCSETLTFKAFSTVNICERFNSRISIKSGCMNLGKGVEKAWNKHTCRYENYCDCEDNSRRKDNRKGEWKHGPSRCCELKKACRSKPCKEGEICRENVYGKGFWCDKGCYNFETRGHDYRGKVKVTKYGRVCRRWDGLQSTGKKRPHFYTPAKTKYEKYDLRENYCRNPSWDSSKRPGIRPWCYTDDIGAETHWEYCDIPACKTSAEAKNQQRHQAWIERREKSKRMLRARTEKTGFNPSIRSNWLKLVKNV